MNYCIIGAARSGIAAARLAVRKGNSVFVTESAQEDQFIDMIKELQSMNCQYEFGGNTDNALQNCDCVIVSPGVPPHAEIIKKAHQKKIPVISELEFASRYINNPIIAITGTNGKTTTTSLVEFIFKISGKDVVAAGNIGIPLSDIVDNISPEAVVVVEVSSYQLEYIDKFRPDVAIILNISPDHLSYHGTMENYINAKFKLAKEQKNEDFLILNADDELLLKYADINNPISQIYHFSLSPVQRGIFVHGDTMLYTNQQQKEEIMQISEILIQGIHNRYNSMAAAIAAKVWKIRNENIRDSLMRFQGVEHRLEHIKSIAGVDYINDSKATNVNATWYALSSYERPIIWIAGGLADNNDYSLLDKLIEKKIKTIISIGKEQDAIFERYCTMKPCKKADSLVEAVKISNDIAETGDVVLFAPACKSFDQFLNFEHRGQVFKQAVYSL